MIGANTLISLTDWTMACTRRMRQRDELKSLWVLPKASGIFGGNLKLVRRNDMSVKS